MKKSKVYRSAKIAHGLVKAAFIVRVVIEAFDAIPYLHRLCQAFLETGLGHSLTELPWSVPPYSTIETIYKSYLQVSGIPALILLLCIFAATRFPYDKVKQLVGAIKATKSARYYIEKDCYALSIITEDYEEVIKIPPHSEVNYGSMTIVRTKDRDYDRVYVQPKGLATRYELEPAEPKAIGNCTLILSHYRF